MLYQISKYRIWLIFLQKGHTQFQIKKFEIEKNVKLLIVFFCIENDFFPEKCVLN